MNSTFMGIYVLLQYCSKIATLNFTAKLYLQLDMLLNYSTLFNGLIATKVICLKNLTLYEK